MMTRILFVCRGNTCRSPMAEVAARDVIARAAGAGPAAVSSAGIAVSTVGGPADPRAVTCVRASGLDLSAHETRQVDAAMLSASDRIYALDRGIRDRLVELASPAVTPRISLLTSLISDATSPDIDDPYSGTAADYDRALAIISRAIDALAAALAAGK